MGKQSPSRAGGLHSCPGPRKQEVQEMPDELTETQQPTGKTSQNQDLLQVSVVSPRDPWDLKIRFTQNYEDEWTFKDTQK